jgi:thiamine-phosphate pyrophosphorylase
MPPITRILDANANRAREALRVMEEAARFVLDDAELSRALKQLRHELGEALARIEGLERHRDTPGDVGTTITTEAERSRATIVDVAVAAGKRLTEALRALEEYTKLLPPPPELPPELLPEKGGSPPVALSDAFKSLRYRAYDLDQRLHRALSPHARKQWKLCLLLTESLCAHHAWDDVLRAALDAGLDCVQVREKALDAGPLLARVRQVLDIVAGRAAVIVNDRPDIALAAGASGVHLGQTDLPPAVVRRQVGRQLLIGVSTNHLEQAEAALREGADYLGLGPMFPTTTVGNKPDIAGPAYVTRFLKHFPGAEAPHLAIGGITPDNARQVIDAGARGLAVSSAICAAQDPAAATAALLNAFKT